jgi:hypothetical protein
VGHLYAIDATKRGDITRTGVVWHRGGEDFHRTISTVAIADGLLYAADPPFVADGKVYQADEDGEIAILKHGKEMQLIREIHMGSPIYTTPVAHQGVLFVSTRSQLFAIAAQK